MPPVTHRVAPDGSRITNDGLRPAPGGVRGAPATDDQGRPRCVNCLTLLPAARGRSPYCADCRAASRTRAATRRNAKRRTAPERRAHLRTGPHYEGDGYTYGRAGVYLDAALLDDVRNALAATLSGYATWYDTAAGRYDDTKARQYHRALNDLLPAVRDLNDCLRGPFWPHTDHRSRKQDGTP